MNMLQNLIKHFLLVCRHKWHVFKLCCQAGIPLQGLLHDLSKFSPTEFRESAKYYNGKCFTTHGPLQYFERQTYGQFVHPQIQDFMRAVFTAYVEEGDAMITKQRLLNLYNSYFRCDVRNDG